MPPIETCRSLPSGRARARRGAVDLHHVPRLPPRGLRSDAAGGGAGRRGARALTGPDSTVTIRRNCSKERQVPTKGGASCGLERAGLRHDLMGGGRSSHGPGGQPRDHPKRRDGDPQPGSLGRRARLLALFLLLELGGLDLAAANEIPDRKALSAGEVARILRQAVAEAQARDAPATIAVVDRVGNVLAVYVMAGAEDDLVRFDAGRQVVDPAGLASPALDEFLRGHGRPTSRRPRRSPRRSPAPICRPAAMPSAPAPRARSCRRTSTPARRASRAARCSASSSASCPARTWRSGSTPTTRRPRHGRPGGSAPSARRSACRPIRAACRSTRTARWSAASA